MDRLASITAFVHVAESGGFRAVLAASACRQRRSAARFRRWKSRLGCGTQSHDTPGKPHRDRPRVLRALRPDPARAGGGGRGCRRATADAARRTSRVRPNRDRAFHRTGGHRIPGSISGRIGRSSHRRPNDRRRPGRVRPGDRADLAPRYDTDQSGVSRDGIRRSVCSPGYLENHAPPRTPADLANHNCLLYTYSAFGREWPFIDAAGNRLLTPVSGISSPTASMRCVRWWLQGLACGWCRPISLPTFLLREPWCA